MTAILKREVRSYLSSPVGYVCIAALMALYGFWYFAYVYGSGSTGNIPYVYQSIFMFVMVILPVLTMKSMSEDRKNKTDQALLTAPVGVTAIVMGKFLSAYFIYFIATTLGLLPGLTLSFFANPPYGLLFGNYIGTLLYGGAMIAIGVFVSSLTESQVIAAVGTFVVSVVLMYADGLASSFSDEILTKVVSWISFNARYIVFTKGLFDVPSVIFFISVMAIFVFLTARRLESRRWN